MHCCGDGSTANFISFYAASYENMGRYLGPQEMFQPIAFDPSAFRFDCFKIVLLISILDDLTPICRMGMLIQICSDHNKSFIGDMPCFSRLIPFCKERHHHFT